jgi:hypothetical protein
MLALPIMPQWPAGFNIKYQHESVSYRKNGYTEALAKPDLSDDDYADLYNDEQLLKSILT